VSSLRGRDTRALRVGLHLGVVALSFCCGPLFAQELLPGTPQLAAFKTEGFALEATAAAKPRETPLQHPFLDQKNRILFCAVAGLSAGDFAVTRANLANGGKELNPFTRLFTGSTAGLATNFIGETVSVVGLSYYFHRTGHHRLERLSPLLNIAASSLAVAYSLRHH